MLCRKCADRILILELSGERVAIPVHLTEDPLQYLKVKVDRVEILVTGTDTVLPVILEYVFPILNIEMDYRP